MRVSLFNCRMDIWYALKTSVLITVIINLTNNWQVPGQESVKKADKTSMTL